MPNPSRFRMDLCECTVLVSCLFVCIDPTDGCLVDCDSKRTQQQMEQSL